MIEFKLMLEAEKTHRSLHHLFWETDRLEASGKSILLVDRARARYERRVRDLVLAMSKKRKAETNQPSCN